MQAEIKTWLHDILSSIHEIESFISELPGDFEFYQKDIKTKRAVERNIEIIGEAMNRIVQFDQNYTLTNSRKMIDTRNRIIHGYDTVSDEIIWSIAIVHLPILKLEIEQLLNS